jgi:3'-phosphoadenosine 5'-phosphosulfate synthase
VAFISPYSKDRDFAKKIHQDAGIPFYECHISASLETCEGRDVKGLYKLARAGTIKNFTGVSDPYEAPVNADLDIKTGDFSVDTCVTQVIKRMSEDGLLKDNNVNEIAPSLYREVTAEQQAEIS